MARTFSYEVIEDGYKIFINGNPNPTIIQTGHMPYPDTKHTFGTQDFFVGCAENNIAKLIEEDENAEKNVVSIESMQAQLNDLALTILMLDGSML